ncbi:unnamed protein product [Dovyalis caffra]|uniref:Uncharacterized protein n=1 Tax=Dovyalis caffra TaxID=77055 RepID=A0AAV1RI22_9ROSI|nr:unnamed protein product [Dovyalis caffra]
MRSQKTKKLLPILSLGSLGCGARLAAKAAWAVGHASEATGLQNAHIGYVGWLTLLPASMRQSLQEAAWDGLGYCIVGLRLGLAEAIWDGLGCCAFGMSLGCCAAGVRRGLQEAAWDGLGNCTASVRQGLREAVWDGLRYWRKARLARGCAGWPTLLE